MPIFGGINYELRNGIEEGKKVSDSKIKVRYAFLKVYNIIAVSGGVVASLYGLESLIK